MARKPFKLVTSLDLSGNSIEDVLEIFRKNYEDAALRSLTIRAGSDPDPLTAPDSIGGPLNLYSGEGYDADFFGAINLQGGGVADLASIKITPAGISAATYNNTPFTIATGTGATILTSATDTTGVGAGALQVAGGTYIAKQIYTSGTTFSTDQTTYSLLDASATTITAGLAATLLTIGSNSGSAQVLFRTTRDAVSATDAGVEIAGGLGVGANLFVGANTTLGTLATHSNTLRGSVTLTDSAVTAPLTLGADITIYRSGADHLAIDAATVELVGSTLIVPATVEGQPGAPSIDLFSQAASITLGSSNAGTTVLAIESDRVEVQGTTPYLRFFEDPATEGYTVPTTVGTLFYSVVDKSLSYHTAIADTTINLGQETVILVENAAADANGTIANGTVVYFTTTATGTVPHIRRALADGIDLRATEAVGVATHDIAQGEQGYITAQGVVKNVDTNGASVGDTVYLSAATAGLFTATDPGIADEDAFTLAVGHVLQANTQGAAPYNGALYVNPQLPWSSTAGMNALRVRELYALLKLKAPLHSKPSVVTTEAGVLAYDDAVSFLTVGDGAVAKTLVDADSTQALTNKTYEGLTISTTTGTLTVTNASTIAAGTDVTIGGAASVTLLSGATASTLQLAPGTTTIENLTNAHALYVSATDTIASEAQLAAIRGGTGIGAYAALDLLYADTASTLARLPVGAARQLLSINDAGDAFQYRTVQSNNLAISYLAGGEIQIDLVQSVDPGSDISFANLTLSGDLAVNGGDITSTASTFNMLATVTTLNMMQAASSTLNIGNTTTAQTVNMLANLTLGDPGQTSTFNHYGAVNYGGPTGYTISWNAGDNSLDFVKL